VYVDVELNYQGTPYDGNIRVELQRTTDGWVYDWFNERTNDPVVGWYNSSQDNTWLDTWAGIPGDMMTYDVVVYYTGTWDEIARKTIVVKDTGLWLDPPDDPYYPGEQVTVTLITTYTTDVFYVQIVNETGATMKNWSGQVALEGWWQTVWTVAADFPDGDFTLNVRDQGSHAIWNQVFFAVQKYVLMIDRDRSNFLPGETARITYAVFEIATLAPYTGGTITYSAHWLNNSGNDTWQNGTLVGSEGTQSFIVPSDIALYSDVEITYWANDTAGTRTAEYTLWLYINTLSADIGLDYGPYMPGDTVMIEVSAWVGWSNLPDANVDIAVIRAGTAIAEYGASGLTTDAYGVAMHSFQLALNESKGNFVVNVAVSKAGQSVTRMTSFEVEWNGGLTIELDRERYYSGDTVTASFQVFWNTEYLSGQTVTYLVGTNLGLLTIGNTTTGSVSFDLPSDYYGVLWMEAVVNLNGYLLSDIRMAEVVLADVLVSAVRDNYDASDVIEFDYAIVSMAPGANLRYEIVNSMGIRVAGSSLPLVENGTISFTVPAMPADSYTCIVSLVTPGGTVISAYDTATLSAQYELVIQVQGSSHLLGSFEPGETAVMEYTILEHGLQALPAYELKIYTSWDDERTVITTDTRGNVSLPISEDASNGWAWIEVALYDGMNDLYLAGAQAMISIDAAAGEWDLVIEGLEEDVTLLSEQISDQGNVTRATLADIWDQVNTTQAAIDVLRDNLQTTLDAVNVANADIELIMADLDAMDEQLEALQTQLETLQEDMGAVEDDVSARPTGASVATWLAIAVAVLIGAAVVIALVMRKKQP